MHRLKIVVLVIVSVLFYNYSNIIVVHGMAIWDKTHTLERDMPSDYLSIPEASDCRFKKNEDLEYLGPYEILAQLVQAEAGNQGLLGKRLVVDVVLNRIDSELFPDSLEDVIFQDGQFSCINNGSFDKAGWDVTSDCYTAVRMELKHRLDRRIIYFSRGKSPYADEHFKVEDHWFGYCSKNKEDDNEKN